MLNLTGDWYNHECPSELKNSSGHEPEAVLQHLQIQRRNTNHVKDSELASLFGKLKYEENLIDSIYETQKEKSLVSATPLSTAFFSTFIVQDIQDSHDDEDDTRSSHEYLNDLEEEYQARSLLDKFKRFFKKGTQRFSSVKATDQTECHKCGRTGHFARDSFAKTSVPFYQSPFHSKQVSSSMHKPELRPTKNFEAKYNKVKVKLALLSSSASPSKLTMVKNKGLIAEAYEWDKEEVPSDYKEIVEVKVLMALAKDNECVSKKSRNGEWVKISMRKRDKSSVCSTHLPPLKKLDGVEPISGPKTIKSILKLCGSYDHDTNGHNMIISLEREINLRNPQHAFKRCEACGSLTHTTTDHYDIEWFKRGEALQAKKTKALKSTRAESSNANRSNTSTKRYSLMSKAFRVFNTRKQQTKETYHITFDESTDAIKFSKPSVDNINIVESERYPPDEYIHHYEPYQKYQVNINEVSFIDSYERSDPIVLETKASSD
ncbi:retrovirus-related pol polyprotein from transposon TNT 1-94 [Tanacetum coccineum]